MLINIKKYKSIKVFRIRKGSFKNNLSNGCMRPWFEVIHKYARLIKQ